MRHGLRCRPELIQAPVTTAAHAAQPSQSRTSGCARGRTVPPAHPLRVALVANSQPLRMLAQIWSTRSGSSNPRAAKERATYGRASVLRRPMRPSSCNSVLTASAMRSALCNQLQRSSGIRAQDRSVLSRVDSLETTRILSREQVPSRDADLAPRFLIYRDIAENSKTADFAPATISGKSFREKRASLKV